MKKNCLKKYYLQFSYINLTNKKISLFTLNGVEKIMQLILSVDFFIFITPKLYWRRAHI